ncbi:helix-turn-helix domain-containing protein [Halorubrum sp. SD683]|uniref:helix-turn-helix domain-containing protein n=1 Tax=Halorubrum sp. SD683 TaxID=1855873 RepID=UPI0018EA0C7D|nr:helix-turn-helix domain-containing protein [Halorubrum sp. SD683]
MTITTEFSLSSPSLPLVSITERLPPDQIECVHGLCFEQDARMFIVKIDSEVNVSEADLESLDEVQEATTIGYAGEQTVHNLTIDLDDAISEVFSGGSSVAAKLEPTVVTPDGWYERKVYKDRDAFMESRTRCENYGISLDLISMTSTSAASDDAIPFGLTERQYEALTLALSRGYYESPRQTSTEELATELGISQPSLSRLLRRGERQLLSSALQTQEHLNTVSN